MAASSRALASTQGDWGPMGQARAPRGWRGARAMVVDQKAGWALQLTGRTYKPPARSRMMLGCYGTEWEG